MKASIVDLRYKMRDILRALDRNERVTILYHGKVKGILSPFPDREQLRITDHPFFGMNKKETQSVDDQMSKLRGDRFDDL